MSTFTISSGKMRVTDPCYDPGTWCTALLEHVRNGTWHAMVNQEDKGIWGGRIVDLTVCHEDVKLRLHRLKFHWRDSNIGVDSGQAGFFDNDKYVEVKENELLDNTFYNTVSEMTLSSNQHGTIEWGAISSSGYGDGVYSLYVAEMNGEIVAARIIYIDEDSDEDLEEI